MEMINSFFVNLSSILWGWPMIFLLLGTHLYLTVKLRFPQRYIFKAIKLSVQKDKDAPGDVSHFASLATALAATIGTGNIIGVATAITLGGPGAVLWCWLTGVFGISTKYAEGLLAIKYLASFGIGNTVQANAISTIMNETYDVSPYISGIVIALLVASVVLGGVKSIARGCSALVPVMAVFYVLGCIYIISINIDYVWPAIKLIVSQAFTPDAAGGGFVGSAIITVARYGIARGLFSNESGMGSAPIVAAAAQTRNPVRQALVSSSGTFWDTVVICAMTGIVIVSSVLHYPNISFENGAVLTHMAFAKIPVVGIPLLTFGLLTFAFSTILGWSYYGEKAMEYLSGRKWVLPYRLIFIVVVFFGCVIQLEIVWNMADCMNALMAIPNLISLLALSGIIVHETRKYLWNNQLDMIDEETIGGAASKQNECRDADN